MFTETNPLHLFWTIYTEHLPDWGYWHRASEVLTSSSFTGFLGNLYLMCAVYIYYNLFLTIHVYTEWAATKPLRVFNDVIYFRVLIVIFSTCIIHHWTVILKHSHELQFVCFPWYRSCTIISGPIKLERPLTIKQKYRPLFTKLFYHI